MSKTILFMPRLEATKPFHYFPVSLLSVAAPMVAMGEDVEIVDQRVENILSIDLAKKLSKADKLMVSVYTGYQLSQAYLYSSWVKNFNPNIKVIWGGPHCSALPEQTLASEYVDEIVCGDVDTGEYPLPYWLIDIPKYINPATERAICITSYGCVANCSFCATEPKRPYIQLPMDRVKKDITYLMRSHKFKEIVFFDASLFSAPDRVREISGIMRQWQLKWICDARAPEIAKAEDSFLESCVDSGLKQLTIGLESGSPKIVEIMRKGKNHLQHFKQAAQKLAKFDLRMTSGVIFGCPGETVEDLKMTLDYIQRIREINPNFRISSTFFRPLPGTTMTDICIKQYGYKQPNSLAAWAELGQQSHYEYNIFQPAPWIPEPERHRTLYERFKSENGELFM
jgi:radical SAM superfamily enzyme YgiQ (UPF0313 family)